MANSAEKTSNSGWAERLVGFDEGIHGAIGAVALGIQCLQDHQLQKLLLLLNLSILLYWKVFAG